jgi:hypothetical protein
MLKIFFSFLKSLRDGSNVSIYFFAERPNSNTSNGVKMTKSKVATAKTSSNISYYICFFKHVFQFFFNVISEYSKLFFKQSDAREVRH